MEKITILIADDHTLVRDAWSLILNNDTRFKVVAACGSGEEAIELAKNFRPDIVILDINLFGMNGLEAAPLIRKFSPTSKILTVSLHTQPAYAKQMIRNGVAGYLTKNSSHQEMFKAILTIHNGEKYICEQIKNNLSKEFVLEPDKTTGLNNLTMREMEIINLMKSGSSSKEIAAALNIATRTVEVHRHKILKKLNLKNSSALINFVHDKAIGIGS